MLRPLTLLVGALATVVLAVPAAAEPPRLELPASITAEASGPDGAVVTYSATATNAGGQPIAVTCDPASGSLFPLGSTTVTCSTVNDGSTPVTGSFSVTVTDTTPPALSLPGDIAVEGAGDGATVEYTAHASDAVDGDVAVACTPPSGSLFGFGTTVVSCTAADTRGNATSGSFSITVGAQAPPPTTTTGDTGTGGTTTAQGPGETRTPNVTTTTGTTTGPPTTHGTGTAAPSPAAAPDVSSFTASRGRGLVRLRWTPPTGYDHVELSRVSAAGASPVTLYVGTASAFVDKRAREGQRYRYRLVVAAPDGRVSNGAELTSSPLPLRLLEPRDGAALKRPPQLVWLRAGAATYYNVQLYRGATKVLSVWPGTNRLQLPATWRYNGRTYRAEPGFYRWFVWPGLGPRSKRTYGHLLGQASFSIRG